MVLSFSITCLALQRCIFCFVRAIFIFFPISTGENHVRNAATYESQQIKSSIQDQAFTRDVIKMRILQGKVKIFNL